jgi:16S rRNA (cytidine1402-2'-O)-methyltransferase
MERNAGKEDETQLFIETPYRNQGLLEEIIQTCQLQTQLCIAVDISSPTEFIKTQTIKEWKKKIPDINKRPAVFLIYK